MSIRCCCCVLIWWSATTCASPKEPADAQQSSFVWSEELHVEADALLSVAVEDGPAVTVVGGLPNQGLIVEWREDHWSRASLPEGVPLLWWVDASSERTLAVGEASTILRKSGDAWLADVVVEPAPRTVLYGVWGQWAVGASFDPSDEQPGVLLTYRDEVWVLEERFDERLFKVWGTSESDIWAVGEGGLILHFDGTSWSRSQAPTDARLVAVMGRGADDVYAVGGDFPGMVLHWDGLAWSQFAETPQGLSGVWTAPGRGLYVGGDRGYIARFGPDIGSPVASDMSETIVAANMDVHALAGGGLVVAVGADLLVGATEPRHGRVQAYGGTLGGALEPQLDAGVVDAGSDAGTPDAMAVDAGVLDAGWPANGQECGINPDIGAYCSTDFTCWLLVDSDTVICTEECETSADCVSYGVGACCQIPGVQTLKTVCIPGSYVECQ